MVGCIVKMHFLERKGSIFVISMNWAVHVYIVTAYCGYKLIAIHKYLESHNQNQHYCYVKDVYVRIWSSVMAYGLDSIQDNCDHGLL